MHTSLQVMKSKINFTKSVDEIKNIVYTMSEVEKGGR